MQKTLSRTILLSLGTVAAMSSSLSALTLGGSEVTFQPLSVTQQSDSKKIRSLSTQEESLLIKMEAPLSDGQKESLYRYGVEAIVYAGDLSYYLYGEAGAIDRAVASLSGIVGTAETKATYKASETLKKEEGGLQTFSSVEYLHLNILFLTEMETSEVETYFRDHGLDVEIEKVTPSLRSAVIYCPASQIERLTQLPLVQYVDKNHDMMSVSGVNTYGNYYTAKDLDAEPLWSGAYHLSGKGMKVGVVDGGRILASHREFTEDGQSRVFVKNDADISGHATHVAGTIGAAGKRADVRGMASGSRIYSYYFNDVNFADAALELYRNEGILISNHSYGYSERTALAEYDAYASRQDIAVANNPYINMFEAAGNDGGKEGYGTYGIIKGPGNSKNVFTIGALDQFSTNPASLSSCGPVKDGRIKPDLVARGVSVLSTYGNSDDSYQMMSGTSMATPAATGAATLVAEMFQKKTGSDIRHDILKSALINCAKDRGRKGPDYQTGFGMIDAKCSVDLVASLVTSAPRLYSGSVGHHGKEEIPFTLSAATTLKTTISWIDPEANPAAAKTLVNDIDMYIVDTRTGRVYHPYTLDKDDPTRLARSDRANHVDNIEQIEVANLPAGSYKLVIEGTLITTSSQEFAIASNQPIFSESHIGVLQPSDLKNFAKVMHNAIY